MNGLKIVRKKCGYSLDELASEINVTKQTISMWENNKLNISFKRKRQLSLLFRIDIKYFNELDDDDLLELKEKPVYHDTVDKYIFKPRNGASDMFYTCPIYVSYESTDMYQKAIKRKSEILNQIDNKFYLSDDYSKYNKACKINRVCNILELVLNIIEPLKKSNEKMSYYNFVMDVLNELNNVVINNESNSKVGHEMLMLLNEYININLSGDYVRNLKIKNSE